VAEKIRWQIHATISLGIFGVCENVPSYFYLISSIVSFTDKGNCVSFTVSSPLSARWELDIYLPVYSQLWVYFGCSRAFGYL